MMLSLLLCTPVPCAAPAPIEGAAVELRPKSVRTWRVELPADPFRRVSGSIPIAHPGGEGFVAEVEGIGLALDTDGDGATDRVVEGREDPATGVRSARVVLTASDGSRHAVRLRSDGSGWAWASSSVLAGTVDGVAVTLCDLDGNGRFGDVGTDAIAVGGDVAQFFGESLLVGDTLYSAELDGTTLRVEPFAGETGTLDLRSEFDGKGVMLGAIVRSEDGRHSFDLARHEEGAEVPAGRYRIVGATLGLGESRVTADTSGTDALEVASGEATRLGWGGPLKASFAVDRDGGSLVLDPSKVRYVGAAGEAWTGWDPVGKSPVFRVKEKDTGDVLVDVVFPGSC